MTKQDILSKLKEESVQFLRLQFIDIFGLVKNVEVPESEFEKALDGEIMFDGSSIEGFTRIEESDMILKPDFRSFRVFPWHNPSGKEARIICDVYRPDGTPFEGCPRLALRKVIAEADAMGFSMEVGPEAEFFLFHDDADSSELSDHTHDKAGYFDMAPLDEGEEARRDIVNVLNALDFKVEAAHHEVAIGQHEIDFKHNDALRAADNIATFRFIVKKVAYDHGLHATFMPKPIYGINGSGMHCHQSLFKGDDNAFADETTEYKMSEIAMHYLGGLINHCKAMVAITNPLVNSYKRLVPGFEAPVNIAWSEKNRSPLIRIPARRGKGTRIELRVPDPACNPYLAIAVMLKAGLDGIKNKTTPPDPVNKNIFAMTEQEKSDLKISAVPSDINEAIEELKNDTVIRDALGDHIFNHFYTSKKQEWHDYISTVHSWEVEKYLTTY